MNKIKAYLDQYLLKPIRASFNRFPEIFIELVILAIVLIYDNRNSNYSEGYQRIIQATRIGLLVLIIYHSALILVIEKYNLKKQSRWLLGLAVTLFATIYGLYNYLGTSDRLFFFVSFSNTSIIISGIVFFVSVPYFYNRKNYTIYIPYLLTRFLLTVFYTGALILGTIGVISLSDFLFQLRINTRLYTDISIVFATLVGGPLFLGYLPSITKNLTIKDFGLVWKVLLVRIVIPLSTAATIIIFAYASIGRLTGVYQGDVFLVSAFSSLAVVLVAIILSEAFESEINYVKWFRKYLPYPMLLLILNLGVEVTIAIFNEGMSVSNYITALFTDFFAAAYLLPFFKKYYQPLFVPILLSGSLLVASFTPLVGLKDWSYRATLYQLTSTLERLNMLDNNQISPRSDLSVEDKTRISELLSDINTYYGFDKVGYLPTNFELMKIEQVFGFSYYNNGNIETFLALTSDMKDGYTITGYDKFYNFYVYANEPVSVGIYEVRIINNRLLINQGTTIAEVDLTDKLNELYAKYGSSKYEVPAIELTINLNNPKFKLIITNMGATIKANTTFSLENINGILLVDE